MDAEWERTLHHRALDTLAVQRVVDGFRPGSRDW